MEKRYCVKAGDDSDESDWLQGAFLPVSGSSLLIDARRQTGL